MCKHRAHSKTKQDRRHTTGLCSSGLDKTKESMRLQVFAARLPLFGAMLQAFSTQRKINMLGNIGRTPPNAGGGTNN